MTLLKTSDYFIDLFPQGKCDSPAHGANYNTRLCVIGAEQPLQPNGACLLGSFNLTKYLEPSVFDVGPYTFNISKFKADIPPVIRAMDNVVDRALYPLPEQRQEALAKRRMGIGVTGVANTLEAMDYPYGSKGFCDTLELILETLAIESYWASAMLAAEKGPAPLFDYEQWNIPDFITDSEDCEALLQYIRNNGLRNTHLLSIAPTGTISLTADNISSGIEPVVSYGYTRTIQTFNGPTTEYVEDYGLRVLGVMGKTIADCSIDDHLNVLLTAQRYVDSAVSKTCNVGANVTFEDFKDIYLKAYKGGAKGCTTFREVGKRKGIFATPVSEEAQGSACFYDPTTGIKTCE